MVCPTNSKEYRTAQHAYIESEFSNLVVSDLGLKEKFLNLACETSDELPDDHWQKYSCYRPYASSAANLACGEANKTREILPFLLQEKWIAWRSDYEQLIRENPRLDLHDRMQDISEHNNASSWPKGYEDDIQVWIDNGDINFPPFRAPPDFPSSEYFEHLQNLRSVIDGWLYWSDDEKRVIYVAEPQWLEVKQAMRARKKQVKEMVEKNRMMYETIVRNQE